VNAPTETFDKRLSQLREDLLTQADRVLELLSRAVESYFELDSRKADEVVRGDEVIDRVDVGIERASIPLLAMGVTDEHEIRSVLTVVKINNELERIADCAVEIAEIVRKYPDVPETVPATFRVMANSVIGMLRDANRSLSRFDQNLAEKVLAFDDAMVQFKGEIVLNAQKKVAEGNFSASFSIQLINVTCLLDRVADHTTNICEQVIYLQSGLIVKHLPAGWSKPERPRM
jgi:phosphate transport system protein